MSAHKSFVPHAPSAFCAALVAFSALPQVAHAGNLTSFKGGDLVISTVSESAPTLDTAAPIVLQQLQLGANGRTAAVTGSLTLPQVASGANSAISGEFGSASEGILQLSAATT